MARILVVDDEVDVVRMVVRTLETLGHTVEIARDGETALTMMRPNALVTDRLSLPFSEWLQIPTAVIRC